MTKYRPIDSALIEAEEVASGNQYANRQIALWMHQLGYRDPSGVYPADPDQYFEGSVHEGHLLPEYGTNFITFFDDDEDEVTAPAGSFIIDRGSGRFQVMSGDNFEDSYIEVRDV